MKAGIVLAVLSCVGPVSYLGVQAAPPGPPPAPRMLTFQAALPTGSAGAGRKLECSVAAGPAVPVGAVAFSPDGKLLAVGGYQEVLLWDLADPRLARRLAAGRLDGPVHALAFRRDGRHMAVGEGKPGQSGAVRLIDVATGRIAASFAEPRDVVYALAFSPDGKLLAAGDETGAVRLWDVDAVIGQAQAPPASSPSPEGGKADERQKAEKGVKGEKGPAGGKGALATLTEHVSCVRGVAFSPDGKLLATGSADRNVLLWEADGWKVKTRTTMPDAVHAVAFSPDGLQLAAAVGGAEYRGVRTIRLVEPPQVRSLDSGTATPLDLLWDARGERLFIAYAEGMVRSVSLARRSASTMFTGHGDWVYCIALTADDTRLASGCADGAVRLWDASTGKLLATFVQLAPGRDEWLVVTPVGFLATSSPAAIRWNATNLPVPEDRLPALFDKYQNPEAVRSVIAGKTVPPPALK